MSKSSRSPKSSVIADASDPPKPLSKKPNTAREQSRPLEIKVSSKSKADKRPSLTVDQPTHRSASGTKLEEIITMLRTKHGASIDQIAEAVGWQRHSVHGLISGNIRKKEGLNVVSELVDGVRVYRISK
ncbi:MAG: DUF3489 domain-containing protein [Micropepsaceae bacterium]